MTWQQAIERTVTGLNYELVDLERTGGGLLRVYIDRVPGTPYPTGESEFVTVDDCEVGELATSVREAADRERLCDGHAVRFHQHAIAAEPPHDRAAGAESLRVTRH